MMLLQAIRWLRSTFISIPLIVLGTLVATTLGIAASFAFPKSNLPDGIKRAWALWILAAGFVRLTVKGRKNIPPHSTILFCSNHLSYFDPPALVVAIGQPVRFLAKESLFRIPLFGWAMRRAGDIPIAKENPRSAARSLARAAEVARAGTSLVVFPEGGRSLDGDLQPLLSGAFRLAIRAQAPVVPIAIRGSREVLRPGSLFLHGGTIEIVIGEPIPTFGLTARDQDVLSTSVETAIRSMLRAVIG